MSSVLQQTAGLLTSEITAERLRVWGIRSGLSILDQGLTSGTGFLLNLFLARWLTGQDYGGFAVGFATLLFLSGYHNVLLLEPMTVLGPARYSAEMSAYLFAQLKVNAVVVAGLSGLMLLAAGGMAILGGQHNLVAVTAVSGLALPFLLLLWLVRRMCYVVERPAIAAWASAAYFVFVVGALFGLHGKGWLDSSRAFLLIAMGCVLAVILPLRELGLLRTSGFEPCPWKKVAVENWNYGRWLMASTTLFSVSNQAQMYLVAAMVGLAAAGTLRAMQIPSLIMTQIVTATALLVLPSMSYEFGRGATHKLRNKAMLSSFALAGFAVVYELLLWLLAKPLEQFLFRGKFAEHAWLIPLLGLAPICTGFSLGFSMALRASQKPHFDLLANAISAPVGFGTAVLFIKMWGLGGASVSMVAGLATYAIVFFWSFNRSIGQRKPIAIATAP